MCRHNMLGTHTTVNGFTLQHQFCVCVQSIWNVTAPRLPLGNTLPCKDIQRLLSALNKHFSQRFTFISLFLTHFFLSISPLLTSGPPDCVFCTSNSYCILYMLDMGFSGYRARKGVCSGITSDYCEGWCRLTAHGVLCGCWYWDLQVYFQTGSSSSIQCFQSKENQVHGLSIIGSGNGRI